MFSDLSLIDQVWLFSLIFALIVMSLAILVLMGPAFVRDVRQIFTRAGDDSPGPTDPREDLHDWLRIERSKSVGVDLADVLANDADIQEIH